jgi:hypothetical protein
MAKKMGELWAPAKRFVEYRKHKFSVRYSLYNNGKVIELYTLLSQSEMTSNSSVIPIERFTGLEAGMR